MKIHDFPPKAQINSNLLKERSVFLSGKSLSMWHLLLVRPSIRLWLRVGQVWRRQCLRESISHRSCSYYWGMFSAVTTTFPPISRFQWPLLVLWHCFKVIIVCQARHYNRYCVECSIWIAILINQSIDTWVGQLLRGGEFIANSPYLIHITCGR